MKPRLPKVYETLSDLSKTLLSEDTIEQALIKNYSFTSPELDKKTFDESSFVSSRLSGVAASKIDITDCEFKAADFTASKFPDSSWLRVSVDTSRCTGLQILNSTLRHVTFKDSKLDLVNFRTSKLENVTFENCSLSDVDFNDASLKNITFKQCILNDVTFNNAKMFRVDISQSTIEHIKGIDSLKGATISEEQMLLLAPALVRSAGLKLAANDA